MSARYNPAIDVLKMHYSDLFSVMCLLTGHSVVLCRVLLVSPDPRVLLDSVVL